MSVDSDDVTDAARMTDEELRAELADLIRNAVKMGAGDAAEAFKILETGSAWSQAVVAEADKRGIR